MDKFKEAQRDFLRGKFRAEQEEFESRAREREKIDREPPNYLKKLKERGVPENPAAILRDIKTYHPDHFEQSDYKTCANEITQLLLEKLKTIRLGEESIPEEYKKYWAEFRAVLDSSSSREEGLEELRRAWADYKLNKDHPFLLDENSGVNISIPGNYFDRFLSLTLFLDVTLGHAVYMRDMGVKRDLEDPEQGYFIPDDLLDKESGTKQWHDLNKNFSSFAMMPGSGVLLAIKGEGFKRWVFTLTRGLDGKYRIKDGIGHKLLHLTKGGLPVVEGLLAEPGGIIDPGTGKLLQGYRPDFSGHTGKLIGPNGYVTETEMERKLLSGKERLKIEGTVQSEGIEVK